MNIAVMALQGAFIEHEAMCAYVPSDGKVYAAAFQEVSIGRTLVITGRAVGSGAEQVEVALRLDDGQVWGTNVTLPKHWSEVRVPFSDFRYFSHWAVPERRHRAASPAVCSPSVRCCRSF